MKVLSGSTDQCSKTTSREVDGVSAQSEVVGETIPEYVAIQSIRGQANKNRNPASVCYNEGAVELGTANKKEEKLDKDQTYINANHLRSPLGHYILAQAPMANTIVEWFRMIWQLRIVIVVCLVDPDNPAVCERYFRTSEGGSLKVKHRFHVRTISVREEDYGITNYELRLTNKLSAEKHRTLYVISMPTKVSEPVPPRKQLKLVSELWATQTATTCFVEENEPAPILVHGCTGCSRTAAFVATCMLCKSLDTRGEMAPVEVWARLNNARHNAAKEKIHFLSSIECALAYAVDIGILPYNCPQLALVTKMIHAGYDEERRKTRHPSASRE